MRNQRKRNIIIGSLCAVVLLMGVGYAAFRTVLNITGTSNISSNWDIKITNIQTKAIMGTASNNGEPTFDRLTATFKTNLVSPGDSLEYEVTVTNAGNLDAKLDKITLTDTNNPAIKFTTTGLTEGDILQAGKTSVLSSKVEYLSTVTSQPASKTSNLNVKLDYSQAPATGGGGNLFDLKGVKVDVITTGDGLYEDTYEPGRYVYKGANPNNYITFNNESWRILGAEIDGTIKIMKNMSIGTRVFDSLGARDSNSNGAGGTYCANESHGCNAWGTDDNFTNITYTGTVLKDAELNTYLNNDYYATLTADSKNQIQMHAFNIGAVEADSAPHSNPMGKNLALQIASEKSQIWTGRIGLITASDYILANYNEAKCGSYELAQFNQNNCIASNYLFKGTEYWTMSPLLTASNYLSVVCSEAEMEGLNIFPALGLGENVYPVLYLNSNITLSGDGTSANPYTIN